jgi:exodeoxyribonuclease-5
LVHRQALDAPVLRMATQIRLNGANSLPFDKHHLARRDVRIPDLEDILIGADQVLSGTHRTRRSSNAAIRRVEGFSGTMPNAVEKLLCCRNNHNRGLLNGTLWRAAQCGESDDGNFFELKLGGMDGLEAPADPVTVHKEPFAGAEVLPEERLEADEFDWGYVV